MTNFTLSTLKRTIAISVMVFMTAIVLGQMPNAITITPSSATAYDTITLTLDPSKACFQAATLVGAPKIFMHSGVSIGGANWLNVITFDSQGLDGTKPWLLPNGDGTYSIKFQPFGYYGFPAGSTVTQLCAVFNGGDWNSDARDGDQGQHTTCPDFFIPLHYTVSAPSFVFTVNMKKAIGDGIFDPVSDGVYAVLEGHDTVPMITVGGTTPYKFTATISTGVDSGVVYNYKFRINTSLYETVERQITGAPGPTAVEKWWNDEAMAPDNHIILQVDMTNQVGLGTFNPATDFVDVAGSFNSWSGSSHLTQPDAAKQVYQLDTIINDSLVTHQFKFRINASWATSEFANGGPNRYLWIPAKPITYKYIYDNYDTSAVPITFKVRMAYQISAGHFNPKHDYLDIAGDINGWNGNDVLFRRDTATSPDSIWAITLLAKRTWIGSGNQQGFKFRFNGDWNTSEFPGGGPNRLVTILDTAGGVKNVVDVWYNDLNPNIPTPPWAYDLKITGELIVPNVLTASYKYEDVNGLPEGSSFHQWFRSDSVTQLQPFQIPGATGMTYTLTADDAGKFIGFAVLPIAQGGPGDSLMGKPAYVYASYKIGGVGVPVIGNSDVRFYPNPVGNVMNIVNLTSIQRIEIYNVVGQKVSVIETNKATSTTLNTSTFRSGIYFIRFYATDNSYSIAKFIKN
jgi:hypothetical protein